MNDNCKVCGHDTYSVTSTFADEADLTIIVCQDNPTHIRYNQLGNTMLIYSPEAFSKLLSLSYFYRTTGETNLYLQVERDIDEMISNRIATNIVA